MASVTTGTGPATRTIEVQEVEVVEVRPRARSRASSFTDGKRSKGGAIGRGAVIRLDPSKIVVDLIHANLFVKEISDIEVEARIVRDSRGAVPYRASSDSAQTDPVSIEDFSVAVHGGLGWKPIALSHSFLEESAKEKRSIADMRPQPFYPLDGKKADVPVPTCSADVRDRPAAAPPFFCLRSACRATRPIHTRAHAPPTSRTRACLGQLTPEWCTLAFRSRGLLASNEAVLNLSIHPLGAGEGEFSELVLLNLEEVQGDAPNLPRHLVAKFSPPNMYAANRSAEATAPPKQPLRRSHVSVVCPT